MILIKPSFEIMAIMEMDLSHRIEKKQQVVHQNELQLIETAGRTCYKSEDKIAEDSAEKFVARIIASGHHSVLEHSAITVKIICDRGVTHEIVRHRLVAYSQESTRYCNYEDGVTFVIQMGDMEAI
jgi:thymidylate synthase (FAD)